MVEFVLFFGNPEPDGAIHGAPGEEMRFATPLDAYRWLSSRWVDDCQVSATWDGQVIDGDELVRCMEWFRKAISTEVEGQTLRAF